MALNKQKTGSSNPISIGRSYQYDKAGELTQINDNRHGETDYQYDALGRITSTHTANSSETFSFDPAHNLIPAGGDSLVNNQLAVFEDKRYSYDVFGNMTEKKIGGHTQMQFSYDAEHQMENAVIDKRGVKQTIHYQYDPFGRRISKTIILTLPILSGMAIDF